MLFRFFPISSRWYSSGAPARRQLSHGAPASSTSSVYPASLSATAPPLCRRSAMALRHGAPASNKPHPAEKRTPVWLAIWRTWAGFANSQLRRTTFLSTYSYKCSSTLVPHRNCCSDIANLSAHLHRLPTPPPYLRRMRLLPGRDAGVRWVIRLSPGRVRRSSKSPRARILVLGTSGAH